MRYFIAVAEELNFRRAAERAHIGQTPLSRAIRDLEDQLGVQLLVRTPRKLHLTPAGLRLLKEARKVFIRIERAQRAVRETDGRFKAPLRIAIADGIAQLKLSECLVRWRQIAPEIPLELTEMRADELAAALRREEVDAGFSFGLQDDDAIAQETAWRYSVMALLPLGHELATSNTLTLPELLAFPLLSCCADRQPGLLQQMQTIVNRHTTAPTIVGEACTLAGYVTQIATGMRGSGRCGAHRHTVPPRCCRSAALRTRVHRHRRAAQAPAFRFAGHAETFCCSR